MANSNSPRSRRARQESAERWTKERVEAGGRRLFVVLPAESVAALDRLVAVYGTKVAAIAAAIADLDRRTAERPPEG
jgi:hypothetical protein